MTTTADRRLQQVDGAAGRYRDLKVAPGEPHVVIGDLPADWPDRVRTLLVLAHMSDLHVMDAQSPARLELLDRFSDPDSPWRPQLPAIGMYRPQEPLTTQVVEAMVQALNGVGIGPVCGAPIQLAVVTGDMTDNAQHNELHNYIGLLDGDADIDPGSGDPGCWHGVGGDLEADERFWHPDGSGDDLARRRGFPAVKGFHAAATRPFRSTGLQAPWLAVHGNHDQLIQGTVPANEHFGAESIGAAKQFAPPPGLDPVATVAAYDRCDPAVLDHLRAAARVSVPSDPDRRHLTRADYVAAHLASPGRPVGHGYDADNLARATTYYLWTTPHLRCVMLDTVNEHGGWQGSLDREQLKWLTDVLDQPDPRPVVLFSHHPLETLINDLHPDGGLHRVLADELRGILLGYPCVVAWVNGHTHEHRITAVQRADGAVAWWQITTASHIDWPQQSRVIEFLEVDGQLVIACTVVDSAGRVEWQGADDVLALAGLSRELAANNWQRPAGSSADGAGEPSDRNVVLVLGQGRITPATPDSTGTTLTY